MQANEFVEKIGSLKPSREEFKADTPSDLIDYWIKQFEIKKISDR
ncbi:hypothetical protein [Pedobacter nototheniae]|nr:hypothetical protein [Pedobacter nototheniae]